jgi:very-short-patch-repair endonuclease
MASAIKPHTIARARELRRNMTDGERRLWSELRRWKQDFGLHVRRQAPIGPYIADFAIHQARIVVEIDGEHHFAGDQIDHDRKRDAWFEGQGYKVFRITTGDLEEAFDGCVEEIMKEAGIR